MFDADHIGAASHRGSGSPGSCGASQRTETPTCGAARPKSTFRRTAPDLLQPLLRFAQSVQTTDRTLAQRCRDLARLGFTVMCPYAVGTKRMAMCCLRQELLWHLVQRVASLGCPAGGRETGDAAAQLLAEFAREGVTAEAVSWESGGELRSGGPWLVFPQVESAGGSSPVPNSGLSRRIAVRMPDARWWLRRFAWSCRKRTQANGPCCGS